jgi:hypothetical protein
VPLGFGPQMDVDAEGEQKQKKRTNRRNEKGLQMPFVGQNAATNGLGKSVADTRTVNFASSATRISLKIFTKEKTKKRILVA